MVDQVKYTIINGVKVLPFKEPQGPNGWFANNTKVNNFPITQSVHLTGQLQQNYTWPSAEHAFHAQKLILYYADHLAANNQNGANDQQMARVVNALNELQNKFYRDQNQQDTQEYHPNEFKACLAQLGFAENNPPPNSIADFYTFIDWDNPPNPNQPATKCTQMKEVLKLKFAANKDGIKDRLKAAVKAGVIPVAVSNTAPDNWGAGTDGLGKNELGLLLYELGTQYCKDEDPNFVPPIDVRAVYQGLQQNHANELQHDTLKAKIDNNQLTPLSPIINHPNPGEGLLIESKQRIDEALVNTNWVCTSQQANSLVYKNGNNEFKIDRSQQTGDTAYTTANDDDTLTSMLKAFKALHPDCNFEVKADNDLSLTKMKQLCRQVFPESFEKIKFTDTSKPVEQPRQQRRPF